MFTKKVLFSALISIAAINFSSLAFADVIPGNPDAYVGLQAGFGDNHWNDIDIEGIDIKHQSFAGGTFAGYDFNQNFALETGYTYFGKTGDFTTHGFDLLGKLTVPVGDQFGVYAKAGPGYLRTYFDGVADNDLAAKNFTFVYGLGAQYQIVPNLVTDVSFTRFNGNHKISSNNYQPDADLYALGLAYKFNL